MSTEIVGLIQTVLLALIAAGGTYLGMRIKATGEKTHTAVNSERTATTAEITRLKEVIAQLTNHMAALTGSTTIGDLAKTASAGGPQAAVVEQAKAPLIKTP